MFETIILFFGYIGFFIAFCFVSLLVYDFLKVLFITFDFTLCRSYINYKQTGKIFIWKSIKMFFTTFRDFYHGIPDSCSGKNWKWKPGFKFTLK